ncbi:MAG TPA: acylphosphatase [Nitrospirota bacterium]
MRSKKKTDYLRAQVIIHGLVQGVWFRASARDEAIRIGVNGWVRNLPDGSVEALFEGEKKNVEEMIGWCHKGPSGARVSTVDIFWEPYQGEYKNFEIRYGYGR